MGFLQLGHQSLLKKFRAGEIDSQELALKLLPLFTLEVIRKYLRVECQGLRHVPKQGAAIIISNHSGYAGFDALMLINEIRRSLKRSPKVLAHKLWFFGEPIRVVAEKMGLVEADIKHSLEILNDDKLLILFPEGEAGNFKPTRRRYRLQEFKRGFVRLSVMTKRPIIPVVVIGAEETHINLSQIKFTKYLFGSVAPLPLNVLPLPVKWKIKFLPPIYAEDFGLVDVNDQKKVHQVSKKIRNYLQKVIVEELRKREKKGARKVLKKLLSPQKKTLKRLKIAK